MNLLDAIHGFTAGSENEDACFQIVAERVRAFGAKYLHRRLASPDDREDVVADVLEVLWRKREELHFNTVYEFFRYVAISMRNRAIDLTRKPAPTEEPDPETTADPRSLRELLEILNSRRDLYDLADELWLKMPPELPPAGRKRLVLAALYVHMHGVPFDEVAAMLVLSRSKARKLAADLETDAAALGLGYATVYAGNRALTDYLLKQAPWTPLEVDIIKYRYLFGMNNERIVPKVAPADAPTVSPTLEKCQTLLPFRNLARKVQTAAPDLPLNPLANEGLYHRLAFQYGYSDDIQLKQSFERMSPVAALGGYHLTEDMMNMWIGGKRLTCKLAQYARTRQGGFDA